MMAPEPIRDTFAEIHPPHLSVIVACRDEESVLMHFHESLRADLDTLDSRWEIIYVDDGSTDSTLVKMRLLSRKDCRVKYISLRRRYGKDVAMAAGLRNRTEGCVVFIDSDLQHPTSLIPRMMQKYTSDGHDQVIALRQGCIDTAFRRWGSNAFYALARMLGDVELVPGTGDFRLLSPTMADKAVTMLEGHGFMQRLFAVIGGEQHYVEYNWQPRTRGKSKWSAYSLADYAARKLMASSQKRIGAFTIRLSVLLSGLAGIIASTAADNTVARILITLAPATVIPLAWHMKSRTECIAEYDVQEYSAELTPPVPVPTTALDDRPKQPHQLPRRAEAGRSMSAP